MLRKNIGGFGCIGNIARIDLRIACKRVEPDRSIVQPALDGGIRKCAEQTLGYIIVLKAITVNIAAERDFTCDDPLFEAKFAFDAAVESDLFARGAT